MIRLCGRNWGEGYLRHLWPLPLSGIRNVPLFITMWVKAWRRESSPKPARTLQLLRDLIACKLGGHVGRKVGSSQGLSCWCNGGPVQFATPFIVFYSLKVQNNMTVWQRQSICVNANMLNRWATCVSRSYNVALFCFRHVSIDWIQPFLVTPAKP